MAHPGLAALMSKMSVGIANDLRDNGEFPAELRITTSLGETFVERRGVPPGGSTRPLCIAEIEGKFRSCSQLVLDEGSTSTVIAMVGELQSLESVGALCELLEGAPREP